MFKKKSTCLFIYSIPGRQKKNKAITCKWEVLIFFIPNMLCMSTILRYFVNI